MFYIRRIASICLFLLFAASGAFSQEVQKPTLDEAAPTEAPLAMPVAPPPLPLPVPVPAKPAAIHVPEPVVPPILPAPVAPPPASVPAATPTPEPAPIAAPVAPPPAPATPPPAAAPLNLSALTAKDSERFEDYSKRYALIEDSISATRKAIEAARKKAEAELPPLKPKDEFEKQAEYDVRISKWNAEVSARAEKDTKALSARLAELEKAKSKIRENQASFYASVEIKSEPPAAAWINEEAIATPAEYKSLVPGTVKIRLQKEGYNTWETTFQVAPKAKLKLYVALEKKKNWRNSRSI